MVTAAAVLLFSVIVIYLIVEGMLEGLGEGGSGVLSCDCMVVVVLLRLSEGLYGRSRLSARIIASREWNARLFLF